MVKGFNAVDRRGADTIAILRYCAIPPLLSHYLAVHARYLRHSPSAYANGLGHYFPSTPLLSVYFGGVQAIRLAITKCLFTDSEIDTASPGGNGATWAAILQLRADVEGRLIGQRMPDASTVFHGSPKMWTAAVNPSVRLPLHRSSRIPAKHGAPA
jgi:hypothetical protein